MSCDGERRKKDLGYGSKEYCYYVSVKGKWHYHSWYMSYDVEELPLEVRTYRRKCDKPPLEFVVYRLGVLESEVEKWKPKPGDVIKVEELHPAKSWKIWRRG